MSAKLFHADQKRKSRTKEISVLLTNQSRLRVGHVSSSRYRYDRFSKLTQWESSSSASATHLQLVADAFQSHKAFRMVVINRAEFSVSACDTRPSMNRLRAARRRRIVCPTRNFSRSCGKGWCSILCTEENFNVSRKDLCQKAIEPPKKKLLDSYRSATGKMMRS